MYVCNMYRVFESIAAEQEAVCVLSEINGRT